MKNLKSFAVLFFALSFAFTSCDDIEIDLPINSDLADTKWELVSFIVEDADGSNETIGDMDACELDNVLVFNGNSTFAFDEGLTKCDMDDPQIQDGGIYILSEDQTGLLLTMDDEVTGMEVLELSKTMLKLQVDESEDPYEISICTMTFIPYVE